MEVYTNRDTEHEGPQWWAELMDGERAVYITTWYNTEDEALASLENWMERNNVRT